MFKNTYALAIGMGMFIKVYKGRQLFENKVMFMAKEAKKVEKAEGKVLAAVAYLFTILSGVIVYLMSKEKFDRFHAVQAIFLGLAYVVVWIVEMALLFVPVLGWAILAILTPLTWLVLIVAVLFSMWKAYNGEWYKLPIIGNLAEKYSA